VGCDVVFVCGNALWIMVGASGASELLPDVISTRVGESDSGVIHGGGLSGLEGVRTAGPLWPGSGESCGGRTGPCSSLDYWARCVTGACRQQPVCTRASLAGCLGSSGARVKGVYNGVLVVSAPLGTPGLALAEGSC